MTSFSPFTNCGEYLPGQRPIETSSLPPTGGSIILIPGPIRPKEPDFRIITPPIDRPPVIIPTNTFETVIFDTKCKCVVFNEEFCPPPNSNTVKTYRAECVQCDGKEGQEFGNPLPTDPDCIPCSQCQNECDTPPGNICPTVGGGENNISIGVISPSIPGEPTNTGIGGFIPNEPTNTGVGGFIPNEPNNNVNVTTTTIQPPRNNEYGQIQISESTSQTLQGSLSLNIQKNTYVNTQQLYNQLLKASNFTNNQVQVNINQLASRVYDNLIFPEWKYSDDPQFGLYHSKLNFFINSDSNKNLATNFVENVFYRNIFNNFVAEEVLYFLRPEANISSWNESFLNNLSLEKIAVSLNPSLFRAINSIKYPGSVKVNVNNFLETIKKHLVTGTLGYFDSSYYINLANRQSYNPPKSYSTSLSKFLRDSAGLVSLDEGSILANTDEKSEYQKSQIRRQRRLNEDIETKTFVITWENETKDFLIKNAGIRVDKLVDPLLDSESVSSYSVENSPGDGYYLYFSSIDQGWIPFKYDTLISIATYAPPEVRFEALTLMNLDPSIIIESTSTSSNHEFVSGYVPTTIPEPLYFKLNLSSVSSIPTTNEFAQYMFASYDLLADQQLINEHHNSNGFAIVKITIDYDDPLFRYAQEASSIKIGQNQINFKNFNSTTLLGKRKIFTSTIPFGVILIPSKSTRYNPFNSTSKIVSFENTITRRLNFYPSFDLVDNYYDNYPLGKRYFFEENILENKIGLVEPKDIHGITYRFDLSGQESTFFDPTAQNYVYSSVAPPSSYGLSYLIKDVIDKLITNYDPRVLTWFDIIRRMPLNRFGEFHYDNSLLVLTKLIEGYRNNVKIRNVINEFGVDPYASILPDDEMVIIRVGDR